MAIKSRRMNSLLYGHGYSVARICQLQTKANSELKMCLYFKMIKRIKNNEKVKIDRKHCLIHENYVLFKFPGSFLWKHSHAQLFMYHLTCLWLAVLHCKYRVGRVVATEIIWLTKSMLFTVCKTCMETFLPSMFFCCMPWHGGIIQT